MTQTIPGRPETGEYRDYFQGYLDLVQGDDLFVVLENQLSEIHEVLDDLPAEEASRLHAPYTWTIKQVIGHLLDTERIMAYRAARFATGDLTPVAGFDENSYVANLNYNDSELAELVDEFELMRKSHIRMLKRLPDDCWTNVGTCEGAPLSVRTAAYILGGHVRHHLNIVKSRLGK